MSVDISPEAVERHIECEDCSSEHWYEQNDAMLRELRSQLSGARNAALAEAFNRLTEYRETRSGAVAGMKLAIWLLQDLMTSPAPDQSARESGLVGARHHTEQSPEHRAVIAAFNAQKDHHHD